MPTEKISAIQKKLYYSSVRDGFRELFQASLLLLSVPMFLNMYTQFIFGGSIIIFALLWPKFYNHLRNEVIYPRIGYVDFHPNLKSKMKRYKKLLLIFIILALITYFLIVISQHMTIANTLKYLPIFVGGIIFARSLYFLVLAGQKQFPIIGGVCWALAFIFYIFDFSEGLLYPIIYFSSQSAINFIIGGWKYFNFINHNPLSSDQEIA